MNNYTDSKGAPSHPILARANEKDSSGIEFQINQTVGTDVRRSSRLNIL